MYVGNLRSAEAKRSMKVRAPCSDDALFEAQLTTIGADELRKIWLAVSEHVLVMYANGVTCRRRCSLDNFNGRGT